MRLAQFVKRSQYSTLAQSSVQRFISWASIILTLWFKLIFIPFHHTELSVVFHYVKDKSFSLCFSPWFKLFIMSFLTSVFMLQPLVVHNVSFHDLSRCVTIISCFTSRFHDDSHYYFMFHFMVSAFIVHFIISCFTMFHHHSHLFRTLV